MFRRGSHWLAFVAAMVLAVGALHVVQETLESQTGASCCDDDGGCGQPPSGAPACCACCHPNAVAPDVSAEVAAAPIVVLHPSTTARTLRSDPHARGPFRPPAA